MTKKGDNTYDAIAHRDDFVLIFCDRLRHGSGSGSRGRSEEEEREGRLPAGKRKGASKKGKGKSVTEDADFLLELSWLQEKRRRDAEGRDAALAQQMVQGEETADIECGCCFDTYPFVRLPPPFIDLKLIVTV